MHIDKGDYLTFAAIGAALGLDTGHWEACEKSPGIYRRHPDLEDWESRSDISRDGYLGVLFNSVVLGDTARINRVLWAILETGGTVGKRGNWDYVNILPLLPLFLAARFKWVPFLPMLLPKAFLTGFRAHLVALTVMIQLEVGGTGSRRVVRQLVEANPLNPLFLSILARLEGTSQLPSRVLLSATEPAEGAHGWGSCPWEVFRGLVLFNGKST